MCVCVLYWITCPPQKEGEEGEVEKSSVREEESHQEGYRESCTPKVMLLFYFIFRI